MSISLKGLADSVIVALANAKDYEGGRAILEAVQAEHDRIAQKVLYKTNISADERDKLAIRAAALKDVIDLSKTALELKKELSARQQSVRSTE